LHSRYAQLAASLISNLIWLGRGFRNRLRNWLRYSLPCSLRCSLRSNTRYSS